MAYLDHNHSHKRLAGVTGVALVHIVLAIGLTAGLAIKYVEPKPITETGGWQVPIPTPTPTETPTATNDPVIVDRTSQPLPPIPVPTSSATPLPPTPHDPPTGPTQTGGEATEGGPIAPPQPPQPTYTPRPPVPANGPAGWVTNDDYPRIAIQREYEGTVVYQVDVSVDGRVQACRVASTSGHDVLDQEACRRIQRRARFRPATDRTGAMVAGTYRGSVSWQIPD
ncbi:MAG: TonB family protein [Alteraurantiacibacter sp.]